MSQLFLGGGKQAAIQRLRTKNGRTRRKSYMEMQSPL
ncbi:unnamed protein product [Acanthoscelides obtectus]|uniref:Uncharacterized protein n=1 Tax=Acanthoscelides obtectus TaxID=200917 RepID=A0A9P0JIY5_ACAOB|nr:unnamed protein product [Acanthoscelides obtectus]CAK1661445.1 hypothetical protein AOBTE_LOCUS22628 [Acanthoscelides obtectus]